MNFIDKSNKEAVGEMKKCTYPNCWRRIDAKYTYCYGHMKQRKALKENEQISLLPSPIIEPKKAIDTPLEETQSINEKVKAVNALLKSKENENISVDAYAKRSGYKPQYIFDAMNAIFGVGAWGFEEIFSEIVTDKTPKGDAHLAISKVKVWINGVTQMPTAWGQGRITKGDVGDGRKSAQTDAMKKALSYFSIGNRAYYGLLPIK